MYALPLFLTTGRRPEQALWQVHVVRLCTTHVVPASAVLKVEVIMLAVLATVHLDYIPGEHQCPEGTFHHEWHHSSFIHDSFLRATPIQMTFLIIHWPSVQQQ